MTLKYVTSVCWLTCWMHPPALQLVYIQFAVCESSTHTACIIQLSYMLLRERFEPSEGISFQPHATFPVPQYVEAISSRQSELDSHIAQGYKTALTEERRRYCFLVDRQCAVAKSNNTYHTKVRYIHLQPLPSHPAFAKPLFVFVCTSNFVFYSWLTDNSVANWVALSPHSKKVLNS